LRTNNLGLSSLELSSLDKSREELWSSITAQDEEWDIVIVGGGITGAGVFRQAAKAGFKTLLVEQQDYAWGTSSRSSKMVHGGFRYIAQGDIQLTREALHEREQMLKEVPGLVDKTAFVFPLRKGRFPGRFSLTVLLKVYDLLAGVNDCEYVKNEELAEQVQGIDEDNTKGAVSYSDAITDDSRLVMRLIQEGKGLGGTALNYVRAADLKKDESGNVESLKIVRLDNHQSVSVKARLIVNATGAWADKLMASAKDEKKVRPLRGSHLILKADKFPLKHALTLIHPDDGRPIFMFPWYGRILLGTTDLDYPEDLDIEAAITNKECDYLLRVVNEFFPESECNRRDIVASFCGVRPVISSGKGIDPSKEKRGHSIWREKNLISVSGGKLTIWRVISDEVLTLANKVLATEMFKSETLMFNEVDYETCNDLLEAKSLSTEYAHILKGRYGKALYDFLNAFPEASYQEIKNHHFSIADCLWSVKHEQVLHLDDLLFRRTRLGLLLDDEVLLVELSQVMAETLAWTDEQRENEIVRYKTIRKRYYSSPELVASEKNRKPDLVP
jgi:glycerol-3-phosphate dehydrogenase